MNKIVATILALNFTAHGFVFGQIGILELVNPGPRLGEKIEVSITFQMVDLSYLESKSDKTTEEYDLISANERGTGELKMTQVTLDTGLVSIGPLKLLLNNVEYRTNEIKVKIYPALPSNIRDGLWVRVITHADATYLIIEQRIANKWTKKVTNSNEISLSYGGSGVNYFQFDESKFEEMGIDIVHSNSQSFSEVVDKADIFGSGTVSYKRAVYCFEKTADFDKAFKVDKSLFKVYPENGYIETAWVK